MRHQCGYWEAYSDRMYLDRIPEPAKVQPDVDCSAEAQQLPKHIRDRCKAESGKRLGGDIADSEVSAADGKITPSPICLAMHSLCRAIEAVLPAMLPKTKTLQQSLVLEDLENKLQDAREAFEADPHSAKGFQVASEFSYTVCALLVHPQRQSPAAPCQVRQEEPFSVSREFLYRLLCMENVLERLNILGGLFKDWQEGTRTEPAVNTVKRCNKTS